MSIRPVLAHPWDVSPAEAKRIQCRLRGRLRVEHLRYPPQVVAGIDVGVKEGRVRAAVVTVSYPDLLPLQAVTAERDGSFPYVPGLLAFREGPVVLAALERLTQPPDVLLFDAQGLAHPRRMGLATHLGILLDLPAVGCAKSRLCGEAEVPGAQKGSWSVLTDGNEVIGAVVRTRSHVRPVYVSIGHRLDLQTAVALVLGCAMRYRVPQPIRLAHQVAGGARLPAPSGKARFDEGECESRLLR